MGKSWELLNFIRLKNKWSRKSSCCLNTDAVQQGCRYHTFLRTSILLRSESPLPVKKKHER